MVDYCQGVVLLSLADLQIATTELANKVNRALATVLSSLWDSQKRALDCFGCSTDGLIDRYRRVRSLILVAHLGGVPENKGVLEEILLNLILRI